VKRSSIAPPGALGRVLAIGGSDPTGGAGIQMDLATIAALGAWPSTAVTALTVQSTRELESIEPVAAELVARQIDAVLGDLGADAIKTGMLCDAAVVRAVASIVAARAPAVPLVVDPVLEASRGGALLDDDGRDALLRELVPRARLVTPNLPEAERLAGVRVREAADLEPAALRLLSLGASAVLLKGGHLPGPRVVDVLVGVDGTRERWDAVRLDLDAHGTGCALAAGIAAGLALGLGLRQAVVRSREHLQGALRAARAAGCGALLLDALYALRREPTE
jgi:hydroxymethylpyrimidine/phosphomethylpyrimidine kinase